MDCVQADQKLVLNNEYDFLIGCPFESRPIESLFRHQHLPSACRDPTLCCVVRSLLKALFPCLSLVQGKSGKQGAFVNEVRSITSITKLASATSVEELRRRPSRPADHIAENQALFALVQELANPSVGILQLLAETALRLCRAGSAGISVLEDEDQRKNFHWRALVGQWASHLGGGTPRDFGPCGTVLDHKLPLLFSHPERDFPYLEHVRPFLEEGLLIPFYVDGEAVGTIWVVSHDATRHFDVEDLRVVSNLATFASAAYRTIRSNSGMQKAEHALCRKPR